MMCIVILTILYALRLDTVNLLRFDVPNISLTICLLQRDKREINKSVAKKLAPYLKRRWRTSHEGKILEFWCRYSQLEQKIILSKRYDISSKIISQYVTVYIFLHH